MKFQKYAPFEKHIKEAYPQHLSPIYVVVSSQESERKKILASFSKLLEKTDCKRCQNLSEALAHLRTPSLLNEQVTAIFDGDVTDEEIESLTSFVSAPPTQAYLILGLSSNKPLSEVYKKGKKEMVILDLSQEKPWESKQRIEQWVVQTLLAQKKKIGPDALATLLTNVPLDRLLLEQEIEKLICATHNRSAITKADVEVLCGADIDPNLFQAAQDLVFAKAKTLPQLSDLNALLPFIGLLRSQFEMGLKMGALLNQGKGETEIAEAFPRLWPKALQQCLQGVKTKGLPFFKQGLMALFELEFGLKTSRAKPPALLALFYGKICHPAHSNALLTSRYFLRIIDISELK